MEAGFYYIFPREIIVWPQCYKRVEEVPRFNHAGQRFKTTMPDKPGIVKSLRRGRDSNPRYKFKLVQRFSKPALSATQAPLQLLLSKGGKNKD